MSFPAASGSCYNPPDLNATSFRLTCAPDGDGVLVERFAHSDRCAGVATEEQGHPNGL